LPDLHACLPGWRDISVLRDVSNGLQFDSGVVTRVGSITFSDLGDMIRTCDKAKSFLDQQHKVETDWQDFVWNRVLDVNQPGGNGWNLR
jgi:hypothetical protein